MKSSFFSRRKFLGLSAAAAGATIGGKTLLLDPEPLFAAEDMPAGEHVRFGMIGIGMQGSDLLANSIELPGIECVAACDLYDGRHTLAREITNKPDLPVTRRYQELLANKDIDCIVAAVPDHWHKQVVVDAVSAGKDIYCEKPMSHSPADGVAMVEATKRTGRIVQIGSQRVSSLICKKAKEMISQGHARRNDAGRGMARAQRSYRRVGISAAVRSIAADSRLGHVARHGAKAGIRSLHLRALALLEGIRHRSSPEICWSTWSAA